MEKYMLHYGDGVPAECAPNWLQKLAADGIVLDIEVDLKPGSLAQLWAQANEDMPSEDCGIYQRKKPLMLREVCSMEEILGQAPTLTELKAMKLEMLNQAQLLTDHVKVLYD